MTQPISLPTPPANNTQQRAGTTIQPGVYAMRAVDAELGYTQGTAEAPPAPQVAVLLEFIDGPYKGLTITWYGFFTEKTKQATVRSLRTLGFTGDNLADLATVRGEAPCTVVVENDLHGVAQARIRFVGGGAIAMKNTMSEEQKKAFATSMQAFISTVKGDDKPAAGATGPAGSEKKFF